VNTTRQHRFKTSDMDGCGHWRQIQA
jgi:hypothetical protein